MRERARGKKDALEAEFAEEIPSNVSLPKALVWLVLGLAVLLGSARLVVWGAVELAQEFGVSELVIGLTVVALGTSLPELAASVVSAVKKEHDIAIGNVVGSNMFNLLGVLALPGAIRPGPVDHAVLTRDMPWMFGVTALLFVTARGFAVRSKLTRLNGAVLVLAYVAYIGWLLVQTSGIRW